MTTYREFVPPAKDALRGYEGLNATKMIEMLEDFDDLLGVRIRRFLTLFGCAGLYNPDLDCFCPMDDLFACGSIGPRCEASMEDRREQ